MLRQAPVSRSAMVCAFTFAPSIVTSNCACAPFSC
jgi:hypothetical protein